MGELMSQKLLLINICVFVSFSFFMAFLWCSQSKILKKNKSKSRRNEVKKKEIFH